MAPRVVCRRTPVGEYGMIVAAVDRRMVRVMLMAPVAVVVQPRAEHVEVGLQRLQQLVDHVATRHRPVAKGVVVRGAGGRPLC